MEVIITRKRSQGGHQGGDIKRILDIGDFLRQLVENTQIFSDGVFAQKIFDQILECLVDTCIEFSSYDLLLRFALIGWHFNATCVKDSAQEVRELFKQGYHQETWRTIYSRYSTRSTSAVSFEGFQSQMKMLYS